MRESSHITKSKTQKIFNAFNFAHTQGMTFNKYVVIHVDETVEQSGDTAIKKILSKYREWLSYRNKNRDLKVPPTYAFTRENPNNNHHVNLCFYIDPKDSKDFDVKLDTWVQKVQGEPFADTIKIQPIEAKTHKNVANYILKGVDPEYVDYFHLRDLYESKGPQGIVFGQRAGFSRNLGPVAIRRYKNLVEYDFAQVA